MAEDENDSHDPDNGQFAPKDGGGSGNLEDLINDLPSEVQKKISQIKIDFSKDNVLPSLNTETLEVMGKPDKPVLLKQNIIEKNRETHKDLTADDYKLIIGKSLYDYDEILKASYKNPSYFNFVSRIGKDKSTIVLLEMSETKENYEIVNLHFIGNKGVSRKKKRDIAVRNS